MEARDSFVLAKAEYGICQHMWDIQALDAEVCDLIYGETLRGQSNALGLQLRGSQGSCERTLPSEPKFCKILGERIIELEYAFRGSADQVLQQVIRRNP